MKSITLLTKNITSNGDTHLDVIKLNVKSYDELMELLNPKFSFGFKYIDKTFDIHTFCGIIMNYCGSFQYNCIEYRPEKLYNMLYQHSIKKIKILFAI